MIGLIPFIQNDYFLTLVDIGIIVAVLVTKYESKDILFLLVGFFVMTVSEVFFVSTGVETFTRNTFFGVFPLWLPVLWAYSFMAMKRVIVILNY